MTTNVRQRLADPLRRVAAPLRQQVIGLLREAISGGEFRPGERLVEKTLCDRYAVSRTVVREALRHLEAEGLVDIVANRGPVVRVLSDQEADSLYEMRGALEGLAGALFAERATPEQHAELTRSLEQVRTAAGQGSPAELLQAEDALCDTLVDGSGNSVVLAALRTVRARIHALRGMSLQAEGRLPDSLRELTAVVDAAAHGDPELARLRCVEHVTAAAAAMRAVRDARRTAAGT